MEHPSRRRRPVTYGKSTRKRLSDISEIFASPRAAPASRDASPDGERRVKAPQMLQLRQAAKPAGVDKQLKLDKKRPVGSSHEEAPTTSTTSSSSTSSTIYVRETWKTGKKVQQEDHGVYDIPSSEEEEDELPTSPRSQKRKRKVAVTNTTTSTSTTTKTTTKTSRERASEPYTASPHSFPDLLADEMAPTSKRPRSAARSRTEPATKKITADAKITKAARALKPQEVTEKKAKVEKQPANATESPLPRSRVTRSQSRQPSEPPENHTIEAATTATRRPNPPKRNTTSGVTTTKAARKVPEVTPGKPVKAPKLSPEVSVISKGEVMDSLDHLMQGTTPMENIEPSASKSNKRNAETATSRPKTLVKAKSDIPKAMKMDYDFFGGDTSPGVAPPRKRLIDSLGGGPSRPAKRSCTSSSSDDGMGSSYSFSQQSHTLQAHSQPLPMETEVDESSQDVAVLTVPKPMLSNGRIGPKVTYARERSYRVEESNMDEMDILNMPLPVMSLGNRRRLEPTKPKDDMDLEGPSTKSVKSIHELRAAGEHSRFTDDVEELFGDIDPKRSLSIQRSGYQQVATKLREKNFLQKFRANAFDERLLCKLDINTDEIICFTISFIALCLLHDDPTPRTMLQLFNNGARPMLVRMLSNPKDILAIAKDRKSNMSRAARESISDLAALVRKHPSFPESAAPILSPQLISLKVLDTLVRQLREHGNHDTILPPGALSTLVEILPPLLSKPPKPASRPPLLGLVISILEAYSIGGRVSFSELSPTHLHTLAGLLSNCIARAEGQNLGKNIDLGMDIQLALRLYINISNDRLDVCDTLGPPLTPVLIQLVKKSFTVLDAAQDNERAAYLDLLVLSFGLLLNFAENSALARAAVSQIIPGTQVSGIDTLLAIFVEKREKTVEAESMEESHTNVVFGYLSVLLGDLCRDDGLRYVVRGALKGSLRGLGDAIEEFVRYNRKVDGLMEDIEGGGEGGGRRAEGLTRRYEDVCDRLRAYG